MQDFIKAAYRLVYELDLQYETGCCYFCDASISDTFMRTEWEKIKGSGVDFFKAKSAWEETLPGGSGMSHNILHEESCPVRLTQEGLARLGYTYDSKPA